MKKNWFMKLSLCLIIIIVLVFFSIGSYASTSYRASEEVYDYLESDENTTISDLGEYISFTPTNTTPKAGVIFYPGAKVDVESYAPLFRLIAERGYKCFMVRMPYQMAFFHKNVCNSIRNNNSDIDDFYLVGHSLGGATFSYTDTSSFKGIVLLASYMTTPVETPVLLIRGSNDGVMNVDSFNDSKVNYKECIERIVVGGNHAGFGMYGSQANDNEPNISNLSQISQTRDFILDFMENVKPESSI